MYVSYGRQTQVYTCLEASWGSGQEEEEGGNGFGHLNPWTFAPLKVRCTGLPTLARPHVCREITAAPTSLAHASSSFSSLLTSFFLRLSSAVFSFVLLDYPPSSYINFEFITSLLVYTIFSSFFKFSTPHFSLAALRMLFFPITITFSYSYTLPCSFSSCTCIISMQLVILVTAQLLA